MPDATERLERLEALRRAVKAMRHLQRKYLKAITRREDTHQILSDKLKVEREVDRMVEELEPKTELFS